jgi:hypothetical protein
MRTFGHFAHFQLLALSALCATAAAAQDRFEIQVYDTEVAEAFHFGLELHTNYVLSGTSVSSCTPRSSRTWASSAGASWAATCRAPCGPAAASITPA